MVLSTMIIKCEMIWEHIEGSDLYKGRGEGVGGCDDGLGMVIGRQVFISPLTGISVCREKRNSWYQYSFALILKLFFS